jgi:hypothetical protein
MTASIDESTTVEALRAFPPRSAEVTELDKVRTERLVAGQQRI